METVVPCEDFEQNCLSTFESAKVISCFPKSYFLFSLCKTISSFPIESFRLVLTNINKSVKK